MSLFHSGMNHWQRQLLSDRLHKKHQRPPAAEITPPIPPAQPKRTRSRKLKPERPAGNENPIA